ncbi:phytanoyl-CoA dioxygenase family protein [Piscinibacter sakaiensis]|uniref:Phytanoyl-CoA dioxygenase n=1 Tax=Piscinibacter sakaiensis TaxID=1547922 RepID=A0A0K8P7M1_PISS1|nr:phytanoyl-CoA dioxygenase family protein [Piscinibacter sakaiensis]GAP38636.1 phytanoyl-CoA dioxygenase [Piscinibacter sakaiensis]
MCGAELSPRIDAAARAAYARDGWLVLPDFVDAGTRAVLARRAADLVDAFEPQAAGVFSTRDPARTADAALIASAHAVHCFLEEEAVDDAGRLRVPKQRAVNKIGHALHDLDPVFEAFSHGPALAGVAEALGLAEPRVWQSQLIFKQPGIGGEVRWHQDATYFVTTPHSVTTFWFAFEDADESNGCLWVEPGGHRGPLRERFVREGERLRLERLDPAPWPGAGRAVPLPVAAGTLVVFHGLLPHYSAPNRSPRSRLAYTLHVTDGRCAYAPENWLQREGVRGFLPG